MKAKLEEIVARCVEDGVEEAIYKSILQFPPAVHPAFTETMIGGMKVQILTSVMNKIRDFVDFDRD